MRPCHESTCRETVPANTNGKSGAARLLIGSERATCPSDHIVGSLTLTLLACGIETPVNSPQLDLEHSCASRASLTQLKRVHYPWLRFLPEFDAVDVPREVLYGVATG
jgi:hypothetical protein